MIENKELGFIFVYLGSFGLSDTMLDYFNVKNIFIKVSYYLLLFLVGIYLLYRQHSNI